MKILNLFLVFILLVTTVFAQQDSLEHELSGNVQELSDFHEVIYKIWHEAYPEKNYEALKSFTKEINDGADKVFKAELPGILRDKKFKWEKGLQELKSTVENYNIAVEKNDNQGLLDAAENLHAKFEMMIRVIRPVLKEVDEFHKLLYVVYHKDLPEKKFDNIRTKADEFVVKAEAITKAKLSKRLENKTEKFNNAANQLLASCQKLKSTFSAGNDEAVIEKDVKELHSKYQILEMVFE